MPGWTISEAYANVWIYDVPLDYYPAYGPGEKRYVYGMRVIQERDVANTPTVAYTRGSDLSGSFEGAGGIGGLLARSHGYSVGSWSTHNYYHADGGGNITMLIDASQVTVASYRYDCYGNRISSSGALAEANMYRFSSKEWNNNWSLYYRDNRAITGRLRRGSRSQISFLCRRHHG